MKCNECNGTGIEKDRKDLDPNQWFFCRKCFGSGEVNWLEQIFGKGEKISRDVLSLRMRNVEVFWSKFDKNENIEYNDYYCKVNNKYER
jgi:excinuclease UvrABC ATPase subunit